MMGEELKPAEEKAWKEAFVSQLQKRVVYLKGLKHREALPEEAKASIEAVIAKLKS
jgi:hypothetical protein